MPLYTDSNYYYSGGSSQLYSPYYPGSSSAPTTSSSIYNPYSSTYNRAIAGSYVVPISTPRTSSYTSTHGLSSSRYQPKLSTITETSPLISAARHTTLMPLTRIQSPKYTSYSTPTPVHTPKYIPPRPILINTADIDVSANRYRKRKEETLRQAQRESEYTSPTSSIKRRNSAERRAQEQQEEERVRNEIAARQAAESKKEASPEKHINRSTIKRNRAVVRLSTIRSRSKERNKNKSDDSSPEPEKKFRDLPTYEPPEEIPLKWREKLADDLAAMPVYPNKKSPGDVLREKYLIQDSKDDEDYAAQCRAQRMAAGLPKETIEQVIVELDPLHHTVRRLSIPQCPTFHDICEDISSDKIDDDLNAGALRRRASIIQCQEQELLNELQKSASGTFQMITMERRGSHDSVDEIPHKRHSKRSTKKGKKIRTKITAIVDVENAPPLGTILQEREEEFDTAKIPRPKFTVNVESVEEHHEIHKVFKLPKKKSVKRVPKVKQQELPEGFMSSLPKPQSSPKKKFVKPTAEIFTFDEKAIEQASQNKAVEKVANTDAKTPGTPTKITEKNDIAKPTKTVDGKDGKDLATKTLLKEATVEEKKSSAKSLTTSQSLDGGDKPALAKTLEKSNSINVELKTPTSPKTQFKNEETSPLTTTTKKEPPKPLEKSSSINIELKAPTSPKTLINKDPTPPATPKTPKELAKSEELITPKASKDFGKPEQLTALKASKELAKTEEPTTPKTTKELAKSVESKPSPKTLKTSVSVDSVTKTNKILEKTNSINIELKSPLATTKKEEDKKVLKTSQSLDNEPKPKLAKTLEKSNSINIELKTPTTPKTPFAETIKEEPTEVKVATPKPIKKSVMKSDSGEDFWAQIGSRETMYMNKRKKEIVESQWKKREDLLESTKEEDVKNIQEIKTLVTSQKIEALKKADEEQQNSKGLVSRSNSNESALKKKSPIKAKEDNFTEEEKGKKKISPLKKKSPKEEENKAPATPKDLKSVEAKIKTNDKLENAKIPVVTKVSKETALSPSSSSSPTSSSTSPVTKTSTTTSPKITGQQAKSPEQQEQAEQNKFFPTSTTTTAKNNNNKNEIDINKKPTTATNEKQLLAKTFTLPTENTNTKLTSTTSAASSVAEATTTKQPETKENKKNTTTATAEANNAVTKPKTTDTDNKSVLAGKKQAADKKSPNKTKATTSPSSTINADQFIAKAPAKTTTSPVKKPKTTVVSPTKTSSDNAPTKNTPDKNKTTTTTTSTNQTNTVAVSAPATTTTIKTTTKTDDNQQICNKIKDNKNNENDDNNNNDKESSSTCGSNLSKFATVSNLAQCLHDVDADLADYLPSSAEISENEEDYKTDDSDFDYSSIDGWEKLTPSMKKKVKQRRRKEKQAEQARFDPQKKVKIDTTRKLYVKEEAPRYPLVATPRPLWKKEKIIYPDEDSEDESDSEESGSTEETEDSDECTTSEEYEDELNPSSSGGGGVKSGSGDNTDPNKENSSIIRMSTCSNDSGFEGGTAPSSPKKMLETSYTYSQFQKSGRFTPPATIIPRFKNYTVDDFHFLAVLGKGSFGKVLLAELRDTTYYYAVKCLKKDVVLEDDDVDSTLIERKVLALGTKHPYLCHLFCTFQTESHLFFVMEYLNGGDLMFHIQESGRFTEERARFYGAEIVSGLKFLHKKGIIYRDLKLDNVLLDYEGHVRIADFGMCKLQIYLDKTADSFCGTPDYMAPEIIKGDKYNQNVDWWSFGVLLYEMLIGQSPFSGCDEDELFWSICNELPWFPVYISAEATSILKGLLEKDYTKRIGSQYSPAGDIVEHIFFRPIDWNLLEKRQIEPPFRPQVKHPLDTQYFDRVFTRERVRLTPIDKDILQSMDQKQFLGFTYTNPHITLD
ncbi:muscle M-line assembly protein unc-89 isoform X1 [Lucilia cuprina]|uniref:muscle M-line assembly protein unc-89 isoform X1 n=1 Tax=Lucilia cuprina TaxID=7375 RepID=UPI001F0513DB|nr:muscle M-line assembly protein unc-89 isoform X1 [Lucilia cuprina]